MLLVKGFPDGSLPTNFAHLEMVPERWPREIGQRGSAVGLIFLPPENGKQEASLVLTRRTLVVRSHKGQISFPGGRMDQGDEDVVATAIRETEEEIGIPAKHLTPLGCLPPIQALDTSSVYPVVLAANFRADQLQPSADEVAEILLPPWSCFRRSAAEHFRFNIFGIWRESYMFRCPEAQVWGLTAAILYNTNLS